MSRDSCFYHIIGFANPNNFNLLTAKSYYRWLVLNLHPDKCSDANAAKVTQMMNKAKTVLLEPSFKQDYNNNYLEDLNGTIMFHVCEEYRDGIEWLHEFTSDKSHPRGMRFEAPRRAAEDPYEPIRNMMRWARQQQGGWETSSDEADNDGRNRNDNRQKTNDTGNITDDTDEEFNRCPPSPHFTPSPPHSGQPEDGPSGHRTEFKKEPAESCSRPTYDRQPNDNEECINILDSDHDSDINIIDHEEECIVIDDEPNDEATAAMNASDREVTPPNSPPAGRHDASTDSRSANGTLNDSNRSGSEANQSFRMRLTDIISHRVRKISGQPTLKFKCKWWPHGIRKNETLEFLLIDHKNELRNYISKLREFKEHSFISLLENFPNLMILIS